MSRPVEGLDSLRAVRTLRSSRRRAYGSASRCLMASLTWGGSEAETRGRADAKRPRCWQVSIASAAFGRRRSCRAPRWGETRHLFQKQMRPPAGWAGACFAGGCATSSGSVARHTKAQDAAKPSMPRSEVNRTPEEIAAVQARFQMAARRRNKPLPTLPLATKAARNARRAAAGQAPQATLKRSQAQTPKSPRKYGVKNRPEGSIRSRRERKSSHRG